MDFSRIIIEVLFSYLATIGFAVTLNIPRSALNVCGVIGILGWMTYKILYLGHTGVVLASFVAALVIGLASTIAAGATKKPTILFNVPSLVPLVPGGQAYHVVHYFAFREDEIALRYLVEVALIAGALAVGFFIAEALAKVYFRLINEKKGIKKR